MVIIMNIKNIDDMKNYKIFTVLFLMFTISFWSCIDHPIDEDGLLITDRTDCYVGSFDLLNTDNASIIVGTNTVDTLEQVIIVYTRYGQPVDCLWPRFSLCSDAKLTPKVSGWTDFSGSKMNIDYVSGDWSSAGAVQAQLTERILANRSLFPSTALKYSVISGNRKIKKEYTILIVERPLR